MKSKTLIYCWVNIRESPMDKQKIEELLSGKDPIDVFMTISVWWENKKYICKIDIFDKLTALVDLEWIAMNENVNETQKHSKEKKTK